MIWICPVLMTRRSCYFRAAPEPDMRKMMISGKKRKLYEKMKYTEQKKTHEVGL